MPSVILAPQGSVWDYLSWKLYGDEGFSHVLLEANPTLRRIVKFEEQTYINVPDKPKPRTGSPSTLPPWKRV